MKYRFILTIKHRTFKTIDTQNKEINNKLELHFKGQYTTVSRQSHQYDKIFVNVDTQHEANKVFIRANRIIDDVLEEQHKERETLIVTGYHLSEIVNLFEDKGVLKKHEAVLYDSPEAPDYIILYDDYQEIDMLLRMNMSIDGTYRYDRYSIQREDKR